MELIGYWLFAEVCCFNLFDEWKEDALKQKHFYFTTKEKDVK